MALSKIKAAYARMTNKPPQDPYTQKYAAQVQWYKMQGMTQRNPRLADINYVAACRARGLDPVWEVIPHGFNRDLTFIRHDPPLHMTRAQIFPDRDKVSETSSMRSQSSKGSSKVSFKDTVEVIGILPKTPKHATLQPLKGALKR